MRISVADVDTVHVVFDDQKSKPRAFVPNPEYEAESVEPDTDWVNARDQVFGVREASDQSAFAVKVDPVEMQYYGSGNKFVEQASLDEWYAFGQIRSVVEIEAAPDVDSDLSSDSGSGS